MKKQLIQFSNNRSSMKNLFSTVACMLLSSRVAVPDKVVPINDFELQRYLGTWYEIARLDHPFERGMQGVTAEYSLRDDGGVAVLNRGYLQEKERWKEAEGKAYFVGDANTGHLKVSFFGPFYGSYIVFELDQEGYQYAFVSGPKHSYLWLLSRTPQLAPDIITQFINKAKQLGFNTDELIFIEHD